MNMIYAGLLLWIVVHLSPSVAPGLKKRIVERIGFHAYQGIFALLVFSGLLLIIFGWRNSLTEPVYYPMMSLRHPAMLLVVIGIILFVASNFPTRIKRLIRHPQLTGVLLWAIAHLVMNGDLRSVTVFGAIGLWALVSMFTINHRDGAWIRPEPGPWWIEIVVLAGGLILSAILFRFHEYLSGISLVG